jgi:hypothetical protein
MTVNDSAPPALCIFATETERNDKLSEKKGTEKGKTNTRMREAKTREKSKCFAHPH